MAFTGDGGSIPLVSLRSRQWVASLRMSGNVRALAFTHDGSELLSTGDDGAVHVWDLRTRRCRLVFADSGNIGDASSLALSADGRWIATGAGSGVVNVYRKAEVEEAAARAASAGLGGGGRVSVAPARELMNLTTNVDTLRFSPDSQVSARVCVCGWGWGLGWPLYSKDQRIGSIRGKGTMKWQRRFARDDGSQFWQKETRKVASATPRSATIPSPPPMQPMGPNEQTDTRYAPSGPTTTNTPSAGNLGFRQLAALERKPPGSMPRLARTDCDSCRAFSARVE